MGQIDCAAAPLAIADALNSLAYEVTWTAQLLRMAAASLGETSEARSIDGFEAVALLLDCIAERCDKALLATK